MSEQECPGCRARDAVNVELTQRLTRLEEEVRQLKARLNTNSTNSSLPPSANPPGAPKPPVKPPTGRKPGGQPGHEGHARERLPAQRVDVVIPYVPKTCARCRAPLSAEAGPDDPAPTWHQVAELPAVAAIVTEHQGHARTCRGCGHLNRASIPDQVRAHGYGPKLAAAVVFLSGRCHGSKRLVSEIVEALFAVPLSAASVCNLEQEAAQALAPAHQQAQQAVQAAAVKNTDETGWSLAGKLCWLWMAATQSVALFQVCGGRGRSSLRQLLGENISGILCSDRWGAYGMVDLMRRQLCWAHLKRDFQKWLDRGGEGVAIGQAGREAVQRVFALWRDFGQGRLDRAGLQTGIEPISAALRAALETGQSSADPRARRFCRNILEVYPALWTFARVEGVEPTNNHAERTLRLAVIWRKISFGNHSQAGCRFTERILTVVQTLRLQQRSVMDYLQQALAATRAGHPIPALVPSGV